MNVISILGAATNRSHTLTGNLSRILPAEKLLQPPFPPLPQRLSFD